MNEQRVLHHSRNHESFEMALKGLDKASEIAVKLGMFPCDVDRLKEQEIKELRQVYMNR